MPAKQQAQEKQIGTLIKMKTIEIAVLFKSVLADTMQRKYWLLLKNYLTAKLYTIKIHNGAGVTVYLWGLKDCCAGKIGVNSQKTVTILF
jgi:hypothetical protein